MFCASNERQMFSRKIRGGKGIFEKSAFGFQPVPGLQIEIAHCGRNGEIARPAPQLAAQGCRVIVPYLRGYGPTRFRDEKTPRSGEQAAVGADLIALMDALSVKRAVLYLRVSTLDQTKANQERELRAIADRWLRDRQGVTTASNLNTLVCPTCLKRPTDDKGP